MPPTDEPGDDIAMGRVSKHSVIDSVVPVNGVTSKGDTSTSDNNHVDNLSSMKFGL